MAIKVSSLLTGPGAIDSGKGKLIGIQILVGQAIDAPCICLYDSRTGPEPGKLIFKERIEAEETGAFRWLNRPGVPYNKGLYMDVMNPPLSLEVLAYYE